MIELLDALRGERLAGGHDAITAAAGWLREGGVLAHPTSTVYGIGGRPCGEIDREIARLKGRDPSQPLIVIGPDTGTLRRAFPSLGWPAGVDRLADRFWPGPLTLVLPDPASGGGTVAVRVEGHPVTRRVLEESGGVMTSTSLNRAGHPPARTGREARAAIERFPEPRLPLALLDAGDLGVERPSTIVALVEDGARLLREGSVPWSQVTSVVRAAGTAP